MELRLNTLTSIPSAPIKNLKTQTQTSSILRCYTNVRDMKPGNFKISTYYYYTCLASYPGTLQGSAESQKKEDTARDCGQHPQGPQPEKGREHCDRSGQLMTLAPQDSSHFQGHLLRILSQLVLQKPSQAENSQGKLTPVMLPKLVVA